MSEQSQRVLLLAVEVVMPRSTRTSRPVVAAEQSRSTQTDHRLAAAVLLLSQLIRTDHPFAVAGISVQELYRRAHQIAEAEKLLSCYQREVLLAGFLQSQKGRQTVRVAAFGMWSYRKDQRGLEVGPSCCHCGFKHIS